MKTLAEDPVKNHLTPLHGWVDRCPQCGTGISTEYAQDRFLGSGCRECKLLWTCTKDRGVIRIVGVKWVPTEKRRTYEIVVTRTSHFIKAKDKREAQRFLRSKMKLRRKSDAYGIYIKHRGDHTECNEGIC